MAKYPVCDSVIDVAHEALVITLNENMSSLHRGKEAGTRRGRSAGSLAPEARARAAPPAPLLRSNPPTLRPPAAGLYAGAHVLASRSMYGSIPWFLR
jgi:hypothetical protein